MKKTLAAILVLAMLLALCSCGKTVTELGGVHPNPLVDLVYEGIRLCRWNGFCRFGSSCKSNTGTGEALSMGCGRPRIL